MGQRFRQLLTRLLDTAAFENVGHMREFEQLLQRSGRREQPDGPEREAPPAAVDVLPAAARKTDRDC